MVIPVVVVLATLVFYPLLRGVWMSFTNMDEGNQAAEICRKTLLGGQTCEPNPNRWEYVALQNYVDVLTDETGQLWQWLAVTLIWTVTCVFFHYTLGLGLAVLLNRKLRAAASIASF